MIWLELRKGNQKYEEGWNFAESSWAPTKKEDGTDWPFWYLLKRVSKGDLIVHLRSVNEEKSFVGYSIAATDGYVTNERPTRHPHEWDFSSSFYRVDLTDFHALDHEIPLKGFFRSNDVVLRNFFLSNRPKRKDKKRLFYVIQNNRLQCLNGAYFSEFAAPLDSLFLEDIGQTVSTSIESGTPTAEVYKKLKQRVGHLKFAENVKINFNYQCCFPNCEVRGKGFLVSGHISRWADNEEFRGETDNGLCFCLIHDKAFENGFFTLDEEFRIRVIQENIDESYLWILSGLRNVENMPIKPRQIDPGRRRLREHWSRVGYSPPSSL